MPITAIHPGEQLAEELHELGMSASELARQLDVPPNLQSLYELRTAQQKAGKTIHALPRLKRLERIPA